MQLWNALAKKYIKSKYPDEYAGMNEQSMKLSEIKEVIDELISEELQEVNHTTDSSGKNIIAQGAPGSVIRFVTEHPDVIKAMREWAKDCQWRDVTDESDIDDMPDEEILRGVQRHYDGGIRAFIQDSNSNAETPVGYKEGVGYVHAKDRAKDPKSIKKPGGGTEHWRIKFQSASDLKKHGNTEMSKVRETIRELVDEMVSGERLQEVTMPHSQPTPNDPQQLWRIVDSLEYGQSISFYNPKNPSSNTTAPWIYIKKLQSHGGGGYEQSGFNLSIEPRMDARTQRGVLKGVDNLRSEDDVTEDEVSLALEAVAQNIDILSMYYIETEEQAPKKKPYEGDPDHDLGDYERFGPDQLTAKDVTESKNMKKHELRSLIKESIEEVQSEMHGFEEQQELLSMKRIQAYAHWGFKNASKHPNEMQALFQKIVKEIDGLVKEHEHGHEVPIKQDTSKKSPLGVTQETVSKTKQLLDQMISQRKKK
jgi:hypothetical protein